MRKKQEFIVEGKSVFVGLEDSKRTWKLCVRSEGMIVHEISMPAEYDNLRSYLKSRYPGCEIRVMYEAGFGGFWLHDHLESDGISCVVTPPNRVTAAKVVRVKTDRVDARRLARNLESGDYVSCQVPDRERREDRQLVRTLNQVQGDIVRTKNRIRRFFDYYGLNGDYPAGVWGSSHYRSLKELELDDPLQSCLDIYLELLDKLGAIRLRLLSRLKLLCDKKRYRESVRLKQSCPGVGWLSAIRFTLEWGELSRFGSGKHLASFAGLTSSEHSTGEMVHRGRITRQGNGQVRGWLIQCAWRAVRHDPVLLMKFQTVWGNSGSKKKAIVAVARKLAVRMRALELSGLPYCVEVIE